MTEQESLILKIMAAGGIIGLAKLLVDNQKITLRLLFGRVILGSGIALTSGVFLIHNTKLDELALIGIACALGISGQTGIEWLFNRGKNKNEPE
ncbi:phage holin family protein [Limnobaculum xujianqingii]|uniref:holin n=1 Tax=Limnobaculum xujianqingii TaxID=2738837 RepID=UPI00112E7C98|nr:holin [Limnobaculum xujianqingii]